MFLGIDKVEIQCLVLVYSFTLSIKPPITTVIFQNQLNLEKKTLITSLMYYITQFWLISFCTWPRAINIIRTPQGPPTKIEMVCWGWQGQSQCQELLDWLSLFFFWLSFWLLFSPMHHFFPPTSKYLRECFDDIRDLNMISIVMYQPQFSQIICQLKNTFLWHCLWRPKSLETSWNKTVWNNK